jgi:hypothetical protein
MKNRELLPVIAATIFLATKSTAIASDDCYQWQDDVTLLGRVSETDYSTNDIFFVQHNRSRKVLLFKLTSPICVAAEKDNSAEEGVQTLQLEVLSHSPPFNPNWLSGEMWISGSLVPPANPNRAKAAIEVGNIASR